MSTALREEDDRGSRPRSNWRTVSGTVNGSSANMHDLAVTTDHKRPRHSGIHRNPVEADASRDPSMAAMSRPIPVFVVPASRR